MRVSAIIVEDEKDALRLLSNILKDNCPNVDIIANANTKEQAVELINKLDPQLVFLDIHLGNENAFSIFEQLKSINFKLIVTTAYEEFALEAFKFEALDYLLKPYAPSEVKKAVDRVLKLKNEDHSKFDKLETLLQRSLSSGKVSLPCADGINLFNAKDIIRLEADRTYCMIHLSNGSKKILSKSLKEIAELLPKYFYRIHTSHLINLEKLKRYVKEDGGYAEMEDGSNIPIARRRKMEFVNLLQSNNFNLLI